VDVLCCALGCVILLWQVNYDEAQQQTTAAGDANKKIDQIQAKLDAANSRADALQANLAASQQHAHRLQAKLDASRQSEAAAQLAIGSLSRTLDQFKLDLEATRKAEKKITVEVADLRAKLDKAGQLAVITRNEYEQVRRALALAEGVIKSLGDDVRKLKIDKDAGLAKLEAKIREHDKLLKELEASQITVVALRKDLAARALLHQAAVRQVEQLEGKLKESETSVRKLEQTLASLQLMSKDYLAKLSVSDVRTKLLEKDI